MRTRTFQMAQDAAAGGEAASIRLQLLTIELLDEIAERMNNPTIVIQNPPVFSTPEEIVAAASRRT